MSTWRADVPTSGTVTLPPAPRAMDALGRNHSLPTAIADLVDNSIDAGAGNILIRIIRTGPDLLGLYVVDDGHGIHPDTIDSAMTIGGTRTYGHNDLGHFGVGLKAASFSQADSLTVMSRAAGAAPVGRRWQQHGHRDYDCGIVPPDFAARELDRSWPFDLTGHGTVVRWDGVRSFPAGDPERTSEFQQRTIDDLAAHLGMTFHKLIAGSGLVIVIDVEDTVGGTGLPRTVTALDPFGYNGTVPGYPRTLVARTSTGHRLLLHCHIWPKRSNLPQFRLPGGPEKRQGLYIYRRDRLLQAGGWEGIHAADKKLQLARVAVEIDGDVQGLFRMNPEKSLVTAGPLLAGAVHDATDADGTGITDYLRAAEQTWIRTNKRNTGRRAVTPLGRGLPPDIGRTIRDELPQLDEEPVDIRWGDTGPEGDLFAIDIDQRVLTLNDTYRKALLRGQRGGLNDAPLIKTLLWLLVENLYTRTTLGARVKDNIELWNTILTAAAAHELRTWNQRP